MIDVLRAFTTAACAFSSGVSEILLVSSVEEAFALREGRPDLLLAGEVGGEPIEGFDFGNSPAAMLRAGSLLQGRSLVLRTSSGTQGVTRATGAERLLLGSLAVASATVAYLRRAGATEITLVACGSPKGLDGEEDDACAAYLEALLLDRPVDGSATARTVEASPAGRLALDPSIHWISPEDLTCATAIDRFSFAMVVERRSGLLVARAAPQS